MREERQDYKGVQLVVRTPERGRDDIEEEASGLVIEGQLVPTASNTRTGRHWTYLLPYQEFDSLMDLGEAVVNHVHGLAAEQLDEDSE